MAVAIIMPRQGQSVESCIITEWKKKEGDHVNEGDVLFSYETDKASFEEEAKASGTLLKILADEGDDVPCLENVAIIGEPGEDISAFTGAATEVPTTDVSSAAPTAAPAAPAGVITGVKATDKPGAVIMPRQGQSVESCIITEWKKKEGDPVQVGDILFSYETDKASFDEEAKIAGTLLKVLAEEGDDVPCLDVVAVIGKPGDNLTDYIIMETAETPAVAPAAATSAPAVSAPAPTGTVKPGERLKVSPRARILAKEQGLDVTKAVPTGPHGRIVERDVRTLIATGNGKVESAEIPAPAASAPVATTPAVAATAAAVFGPAAANAYEDTKLSNVRKVIARSMTTSLSTMAQLTNTASFDATNILAYRKQVKANGEAMGIGNITLNDVVLFAVSRVLKDFKDLNAHYLDDKMRHFEHVNLGMAVDTPRGLLVPTIFGADMMTLAQLSAEAKKLAAEAQAGSISPDYLANASFTVTNLGSFGVESFTPVINPPQTGILGVNTIETRVRMKDGQMEPYQAMALSLTFDHRAIDGAPAAKFLQALCRALENFGLLLAK